MRRPWTRPNNGLVIRNARDCAENGTFRVVFLLGETTGVRLVWQRCLEGDKDGERR